jgi:hypothetical protein
MRAASPEPAGCEVSEVQGVITGRHVLWHSITILRLWGPAAYLRCLRAVLSRRRDATFLNTIYAGERYPRA